MSNKGGKIQNRRKHPIVDVEFEQLLPPLTPEQHAVLSMQLSKEGCRDPLIVWAETGILLDGHHRLRICKDHKIPYQFVELSLPDREAAVSWIVDTQLGRRNLNDEQHSYYMGKDYLRHKNAPGNPQFRQNDGIARIPGKTTETIAEQHGVSPRTLERNATYANAVDAHGAVNPEAKETILSGKSGLTKSEVIKSAPNLCTRCKRDGAVKDCKECEEARSQGGTQKSVGQPELDLDPVETERRKAVQKLAALKEESEAEVRKTIKHMAKEAKLLNEFLPKLLRSSLGSQFRDLAEAHGVPLQKTERERHRIGESFEMVIEENWPAGKAIATILSKLRK